jgi:hypothetical protein
MAKLFAPGIPLTKKKRNLPKNLKAKDTSFVLQRHLAERAGEHYDLRITDGKHAYSWAIRKGLPSLDKTHLAIRQPDHLPSYMTFKGNIPKGYGKGKVKIDDAGEVNVIDSSPRKIKFAITEKATPEEYLMVNISDDKWLITNKTPTRANQGLNTERVKYKDVSPKGVSEFVVNPDYAFQPKIDGAHVVIHLKDMPRVYSHRESKRSPRLIQHTYKIPGMDSIKVPKGMEDTVIRAELAAKDKAGRILPANELSSILNSNTKNAKNILSSLGLSLKAYLFDLDKVSGKDVAKVPYQERLEALHEIKEFLSRDIDVDVPVTRYTDKAKQRLYEEIEKGNLPETSEGIIIRSLSDPDMAPIKAKVRPDYDVYVREVFPTVNPKIKKDMAGGFKYSYSPKGKVVGNVGSGLTDELRTDMLRNPKKYIGRAATIHASGKFESGKLRAPAFSRWHLEKGKKSYIKKAFIIGLLNGRSKT